MCPLRVKMPTQNLVVTVTDISDEDCVGNSLLQVRKLRFGHNFNFCSDFEHFGQDFKVEVQARF